MRLTHSRTHPPTHPPTHSLTHLLAYLPTYSLTYTYVFPLRLYGFAEAVYRFRESPRLRLAFLLGSDARRRALLTREIPHL